MSQHFGTLLVGLSFGASLNCGFHALGFSTGLIPRSEENKRRLGFLFCALSFLVLAIYFGVTSTWDSWFLFCAFIGFGLVAQAEYKERPDLSEPSTVSLSNLRKAFRSSRSASAMCLSFLTLLLATPLLPGVRHSQLGTMGIVVVVLALGVLVVLVSCFFRRPSRLVGFVAGLSSYVFCFLGVSLVPTAPIEDVTTIFKIGLCLGAGVLLNVLSTRIARLSRRELHFVQSLSSRGVLSVRSVWARPGVPRVRGLAAWGCDVIGRLVWGLSQFIVLFQFGAVTFTAFMSSRILAEGIDTSPLLLLVLSIAAGHGMLVLIICASSLCAATLWRCSSWLSRASYADTRSVDPRPYILLLRTFSNDGVTLPKRPWYSQILWGLFEEQTLDRLLVESFSLDVGPVVAIADPLGSELAFGASRRRIPKRDDWLEEMATMAHSALAIIFVADVSDGLNLEFRKLESERLLSKTLFLSSPTNPTDGLAANPLVHQMLEPATRQELVAGFYNLGGEARAFTCKKIEADDYAICCNAFLLELTSLEKPPG